MEREGSIIKSESLTMNPQMPKEVGLPLRFEELKTVDRRAYEVLLRRYGDGLPNLPVRGNEIDPRPIVSFAQIGKDLNVTRARAQQLETQGLKELGLKKERRRRRPNAAAIDEAELRRLCAEKVSQTEIARKFGCRVSAINKRVKELRIVIGAEKYKEAKKQVFSLYANGFSRKEIAEKIGVHYYTVAKWESEAGIVRQRSGQRRLVAPKIGITKNGFSKLLNRGLTSTEIAEELGVSNKTVVKLKKEFGIPLLVRGVERKPVDKEALLRLREEGQTLGKLALHFSVSPNTISRRLHKKSSV